MIDKVGSFEELKKENLELKERVKELETILNDSNTEVLNSAKDSEEILKQKDFNTLSRDYMYRILIENMNEGALIVNPQKTIVYSNQHFSEILGHPLEKVIGGDFLRYFNEKDLEILNRAFDQALKEKSFCELELKTEVQKVVPVFLSLVSFTMNDQIYFCIIVNDVSSYVEVREGLETRLEEYLQELSATNNRLMLTNQELNDANQYLDNFVHTITHDLRAPLSNLILVEEMLQMAPEKSRDKLLISLHDNLHKLDRIFKGLIQIIKAQEDSGKVASKLTFGKVLRDTIEEQENLIKQYEADIRISGETEYQFNYIEGYLKSIIRNLLTNAIKYSHEERKPEIIISCSKNEEHFVFSVNDNGRGIDLKKKEQDLFKPFQRTTSTGIGMGIGLHIVNNMVRKNGGFIEVESTPGKGSRFTLFLKEYQ